MKNFTSVIGWLLMAVVLTVPSFLFYNWWTSNNKNEAEAQAPVQRVSTATVFADAQDKSATRQASTAPIAAEGPVFSVAPIQRADQAVSTASAYGAASTASAVAVPQVKKTPPAAVTTQAAHWSY